MIRCFYIVIAFLMASHGVHAQTPSFYHLTTANGLYDNHVRSLAIDKQGFLWVGTEDGLCSYDGHSTSTYLKEKHPNLPSDFISHLFSDSKNRLWIGTSVGAAFMDSRRQIHRVLLGDTLLQFVTKAIIETKKHGIVIITNKGHYFFDENKSKGQVLDATNSLLTAAKIKKVQSFDENSALVHLDSSVLVYNYETNKVRTFYSAKDITAICKTKSNEIVIGKANGEVLIIDAITSKLLHSYSLGFAKGMNTSRPEEIRQADNGDLLIAVGFNGLFTITPAGKVSQFLHDPTNPLSIIANATYRLAVGNHGEVIVGTSTSGVSMYNTKFNQAGFKAFFADGGGDYFDNYTGNLLEAKDGTIWIGAYDRLIKWNRENNTSKFFFYPNDDGGRGDIRAMCLDKTGQLWVSVHRKGLSVFTEAKGFTKFNLDKTKSPLFAATEIPELFLDDEGLIWVCTDKGVFTIDAATKKISDLNHPLIKALEGKSVQSMFVDSKKRKWFATLNSGVFCFDENNSLQKNYSIKDGLPANITYAVTEDSKGRFYVTTNKGFAMLHTDGKMQAFTKQNGLRYQHCEAMLIDDENMVWVSNKKCLLSLNPETNALQFYDEKSNFLNDGFRVGSCLKTKAGELLWGGYHGICYFYPAQLKNSSAPLQVSIHSLLAKDSVIDISSSNNIHLSYADNSITIGFAGIHLGVTGKTYYQYRLHGFDKEWQKGEDVQTARYTSLPPGNYEFEVKASLDGVNWTGAARKLNIVIVPPVWMRWWFIALAAIVFAAIIYALIYFRNKKLAAQKEDAEAERAINYFAASMHEQQSVEAILWDVARNCIGRLNFEDCVIYLVDEQQKVLVQKAAYGPKNPDSFLIMQPIKIKMGEGIVGHVAQTGKAQLIADTSQDERYIVDDAQRLSEIAVPMIWGEKVIGVIDCEHPRKNYFTPKHLSVLTTIASLCANKIVRAKAEEERKNAQAILTDTQQKMAEAEMQALRAQMNPHFIFNCLNSINRYILKSDEATASLYLTRFAKLIRLILDNSSSKKVLLSNELEALKLYIEMESLRFDKKFVSNIVVEPAVNVDSIEVPSMIIQPYVENAIWHGLLHNESEGRLTITIRMKDEGMLECMIDDNGIGRAKARLLKSKSATSRKSLGMELTEKRLALLNRQAEINASVSIIDKEDENTNSTGTKVILQIPIQNGRRETGRRETVNSDKL